MKMAREIDLSSLESVSAGVQVEVAQEGKGTGSFDPMRRKLQIQSRA